MSISLYDRLVRREEKLSVVGLGYVGLPIAAAFSKKVDVIGFDINENKVARYRQGIDLTGEVGDAAIRASNILFTSEEKELKKCRFHIVAVPTPVSCDHMPDLAPLRSACEVLGRNLAQGSIVVFESTVYPGVTEDVCIPILEQLSGLTCGQGFKAGYSPERINPGDKTHRLDSIKKIVSGIDQETLDTAAKVYELVVSAGVYKAESIQVAEAAKVIENSQRDINIAFMNELSMIFHRMGIDMQAVLKAAATKWNFVEFYPGLVGGHCIGVDPYYLTYKAETLGYHSQVILSGRRVNDGMGRYVAENCVKSLIAAGSTVKGAKVAVLGFTFKENCSDTRNTKVIDIVNELKAYSAVPVVADPRADKAEAGRLYGIEFTDIEDISGMDAVILAVAHKEFREFSMDKMDSLFGGETKVLLDIKGIFDRTEYEGAGYYYWRL